MGDKADVWQGTLALMILKTLETLGPLHGYGIARRIEQTSGDLLSLNYGTLYPALLKLEQEGSIESAWGVSDNHRKAEYYKLTRSGRKTVGAGGARLAASASHPREIPVRDGAVHMSQIWKTSRACFHRLGGLFHKVQRDAEFAAELESHLQLHVEDNLRAGMTPEAARRDALIRLGGLDQAKELYRDRRSLALLETTLQDCRYALRLLRKNPGFTLVAIATLALGIGANTAMFSVMNTVLLRALPVPHSEQLVYLRLPNWQPAEAFSTGDSETSFSQPVFEQLRKEQGVFQDLMAYAPLAASRVAVRISEDPEEAEADEVSGNFFSGLGVAIARGRGFSPEDEASHAPLAVLSYAYWTRRFGRSPSAIGQSFYVKGVPFTVVGVAARDFYGLDPGSSTDFWIPLQNRPELNPWGQPASQLTLYGTPKWWCLRLIGRLAARVTEAQALAQLDPAFQSAAMIRLGAPVPKNRKPVLAMAAAKGRRARSI